MEHSIQPTASDVASAAAALQRGELVAFPTETVYGLGAHALDARAVAAVFALKGRPRFDPLIVHIADAQQLDALVEDVPEAAARLIERFWPGPLTLVLPKRSIVPELVTANLASVAVRLPDHPVARDLIRQAGVPVAAPSANRFGKVSPTTADHVRDSFGAACPLILDAGPCRVGVESTVVSLCDAAPRLLRPGGISREELIAVVGAIEGVDRSARGADVVAAPGMLASHYAPQVPLRLASAVLLEPLQVDPPDTRPWGLLCLRRPPRLGAFAAVEELSASGDLQEAASRLFAALRRLEKQPLAGILALPLVEYGLGAAIMDRLRRAAAEFH